MRYGKWMSRQLFLMEVLTNIFIWYNQKDSLQRAGKKKCASCRSPFMDLSKHRGLGISSLTNRSSYLDLSNVLMKLVCTRDATDMWWWFWYFMSMTSYSLETMLGRCLQLKFGYLSSSIWRTKEKPVTFLWSSLCEITRKECWAYPKLPISIRFLPSLLWRI